MSEHKPEMTGFLATLTPEQRQRALAYRGPDTFGSEYIKAFSNAEFAKWQQRQRFLAAMQIQRPKTLNDYVMRGQSAASLSATPHSPPDIDPLGR